jgi:hypothetical protein
LPFGSGQAFLAASAAARRLLGGWQLSGILSAWTGDPLTLSESTTYLNTPDSDQTVEYSGRLTKPGQAGPGQYWFSPSSFAPVLTPTFGNTGTGLSWLTGPGLLNMDMALFRTFAIRERFKLQFRLEADNAFNTPHFNDPNTTCTILNGQCAYGFGQVTTSYGQRVLMLGAKLTF